MALRLPTGSSRAESETVIRWDDEEKVVTLWSASPSVVRRLEKMGLTPVETSARRTGEIHGYTFRMPLREFRFGKKRKGKPPVSGFTARTPIEIM